MKRASVTMGDLRRAPATARGSPKKTWAAPMARSVSITGIETRAELRELHSAMLKRRRRSVALSIWEGQHDLVSEAEDVSHDSVEDEEVGGQSAAVLSVGLVICGCCCQLPYEVMNSSDRGCGTLASPGAEARWEFRET